MSRVLPGAFVQLCFAVFLCVASPHTHGMVFWNLDNSANQTDPGTGVPWHAVGRVAGSSLALSSTTGTAIHLGNGWMLTADHVTLTSAQRITFDGTTALTIDMTFNGGTGFQQVATGVDLKVFRLTAVPGVAAVTLDSSGGFIASSTLIGFGVGRSGTSGLSTSPVTWGDNNTIARRWGLNRPISTTAMNYTAGSKTYTYTAITSIAGSASGNPAGLGDAEAGLTQNDSGSGMFQFIEGEWVLVGVGAAVERQAGGNTTTFGDDQTTGAGRGDRNFFVPIAPYRTSILAIIPEPSSLILILPAFAWLASRRRH